MSDQAKKYLQSTKRSGVILYVTPPAGKPKVPIKDDQWVFIPASPAISLFVLERSGIQTCDLQELVRARSAVAGLLRNI